MLCSTAQWTLCAYTYAYMCYTDTYVLLWHGWGLGLVFITHTCTNTTQTEWWKISKTNEIFRKPLYILSHIQCTTLRLWQSEWEEIKCTHAHPYFIYTIDKFKEKPVTNGFELMPLRTSVATAITTTNTDAVHIARPPLFVTHFSLSF